MRFRSAGWAIATVILSSLLAVRLAAYVSLRRLSLIQYLALVLLAMSLVFVLASGNIVLGLGAKLHGSACSAAIWLCILLYAVSKLILYVLLLEKVWAVHGLASIGSRNRLTSKWYRAGAVIVLGWVTIAALIIPGRLAERRDEKCYIGIKLYTNIPFLIVDTVANGFLSVAFLLPIWQSKSPQIKRLAQRSSVAALISLLTSFCNGLIIVSLKGRELGWVCLGSCGIDLTINAIVVYVVTRPTPALSARPSVDAVLEAASPSEIRRPLVRHARHSSWGSSWGKSRRPDISSIAISVTEEVEVDDASVPCLARKDSDPVPPSPVLPEPPPPTATPVGRNMKSLSLGEIALFK